MVSREWGAVLIVDDVRTGLRVDMRGTHSTFGLEADLTCLSRAIGNGWPLSVVVGQEHLRQSASSIPTGGAFWNAPSAFAAAHANLRLLAENDGIARMNRLGRKLTLGLTRLGRQHGIEVQLSGPPSEPTVTLADDPQGRSMGWFAREMVALGSFVHPAHPWYLSTAHTEGHIEETLGHANRVLGYLARAREGMRRQAEEHTESLSASPPASPAVEARGPQGPSTPPEEGDTAPRRIEPSPRRRDDGQ
jgi:glutamate-1-semialdehyde 2,1-aminomutase